MQIRVLGCSGGISAGARTSSILVDHDVLLDAGSGVGDLSLDELRRIRHVFLTHSHLDHISALPLLIDCMFEALNGQPVSVYARPE
ncbi:MAG: MBL fold metallo-hydrolase, partial [Pseudomonadota bacterium]